MERERLKEAVFERRGFMSKAIRNPIATLSISGNHAS
jgi:hypothetical protein